MDLNNAGLWWLVAAVVLAGIELMVPGVYLIFFAIAAALTGAVSILFPDLGLPGQLIGFAGWSIAAVVIGRRWYKDFPVATSDPMLNDRSARLVGQTVTVVEAIEGGTGRVRIGDGEWPATGPALPVGAKARIVAVTSGTVAIEAVALIERPVASQPE